MLLLNTLSLGICKVFINMEEYLSPSALPSILTSFPVPADPLHHEATTTVLHWDDGALRVINGVLLMLNETHWAKAITLHNELIRPENRLLYLLSLQIQFHNFFCPIMAFFFLLLLDKARFVECLGYGCSVYSFSYLSEWYISPSPSKFLYAKCSLLARIKVKPSECANMSCI